MNSPKFEICCIARNEVKTIGRLNDSLREYIGRNGIVNLLDTGSEDGTQELARSFGWNVKEVGSKYQVEITNPDEINKMFVVEGEQPIVKMGDKYFDFSAARNDCASMATLPIIFWYDADEVAEKLDIDYVNDLIDKGFTQFEYFFCFAKDAFGNEAVKFIQCKAYDKRVMLWRGKIHELVCNIDNANPGNRVFIPEDKYKLAHYQNHEQGRHSYISGLACDVFENPTNDRHIFYLSRELLYHNRPKSALQGFKKHIAMGGWHSERSESLIHCGDLYGQLGDPTQQMLSYVEAFHTDSGRNAALIKLALYYQWNKNYQAAICYAKAALEIPYNGFYADNLSNYREVPHSVLYTCYGFLGRIEEAQTHLNKCLEYQPYNQQYLHDTRFYFEFGAPMVDGWLRWPEIKFLYEKGKQFNGGKIAEIGSWKGRSAICLCSGNKDGQVFCIDTWKGSEDERDSTNHLAKVEDVYQTFLNNTKQFTNLIAVRKPSIEAAKEFEDKSLDMIFIDAGHLAHEVRADILAWICKVKDGGIICGHDYQAEGGWMTVVEGVDSVLGKPDGVCDSIWFVELFRWKREEILLRLEINK